MSDHPQGRAHLCNAKLFSAQLNGADLRGADLNEVELSWAKLNGAKLYAVELNKAQLYGADLFAAKLNEINLRMTKLNKADLEVAQLNGADLRGADLYGANLRGAHLNGADLRTTSLNEAILTDADLTEAVYAPASAPPAPHLTGIKGLATVTFPAGEEIGLVQLRKLLQDGGLRDLERQATYAIEHGRTQHDWEDPARMAEGAFRFVAFDLTTAYGLSPGRAFLALFGFIAIFALVYAIALAKGLGSIYRIQPEKRLEREAEATRLVGLRLERKPGAVSQAAQAKVELLPSGKPLAALRHGLQFSLLSAFYIGFREFSVGAWLARLQTREYSLQAVGWIRMLSGLQSLLSVYLLAMWALTYFGRPFQ